MSLATPPPSPTAAATGKPTRGRIGRLIGVRIAGTGSYVPPLVVTNEDLAALGCDSDWIVRRTGIRQRRHAAADVATSDLCLPAARACLHSAGVDAADVDLILVATITPDHFTPSTGCHIQRALGCRAAAMDIGAACAGFMYALVTGGQFVANRTAKNVLVLGADLMSRTIDPEDKKTFPLFGDAAGAVLLQPCEDDAGGDGSIALSDGEMVYQLGSEGCGGEMLCIPGGGTRLPLTADRLAAGQQYLSMDGRSVFKWAVRVVDDSIGDILSETSLTPADLRCVILHQANQRIIDSAVSDLDLTPEQLFVNLESYGNTSGASVPLALDEAVRGGRIDRGDPVLLCGFGAGLAWGTVALRF